MARRVENKKHSVQVDLTGKLPPQNIDAERATLGSMMIESAAMVQAIDIVREDSFYKETHRTIFRVIRSLYENNKPVDLVSVTEELAKRELIEEVGGKSYLLSLIDSVATAAHVEHYARIVHEKACLRQLINVATQIVADSYNETEGAETIIDKAQSSIFSVGQTHLTTGFTPIGEMVEDSMEAIERIYSKKEKVQGVPSGFNDLDRKAGGFYPSNLIIVAGRPAMGKTSFCLNIAQHVALREKKTVAIFSLEMSASDLLLRLLCSEARVSSHKVRTGFLSKADWPALTNAASVYHSAPIFIDDTPSISVLEMKARARRLQASSGLDLIIIDYLQLMPGRTGKSEYRQQDISEITRSLKILSKELNVPVIALSQLSRATEQRADRRPQLSDLRESGAIEQDADLVLFLYREEYYDREHHHPDMAGTAEVIIGKNRYGPTDTVKLTFLKDYTSFENYTPRGEL